MGRNGALLQTKDNSNVQIIDSSTSTLQNNTFSKPRLSVGHEHSSQIWSHVTVDHVYTTGLGEKLGLAHHLDEDEEGNLVTPYLHSAFSQYSRYNEVCVIACMLRTIDDMLQYIDQHTHA